MGNKNYNESNAEQHLESKKKISESLTEHRECQNITKYRLSKLTGLSPFQISLIEKGEVNFSIDTLLKITEVLNLEVSIQKKSFNK